MASLGSLVVFLEANIAKFESDMGKAGYISEREGRRVQKSVDNMVSSIKGLAATVGVGLSLNQLWGTFKEVTTAESNLLKMANRLNTTTEELSRLGIMARKTGMDQDSFNNSIERMLKNISNAELKTGTMAGAVDEMGEPLDRGARVMDELGLRAEILNRLPLPEKLKAISMAMNENIAPADKGRVALELFGRSGGAMVIALKAGPEAMEQWAVKAERLGMVIGTDMAQRAAKAKEAVGDLNTAWHGFAITLTNTAAPAITTILDGLTQMVNAARNAEGIFTIFSPEKAYQKWKALGRDLPWPLGASSPYHHQQKDFIGPPAPLPSDLFKPPVRPSPKIGGGGGSGLEADQRKLENFIGTMQAEISKAHGETFSVLDAWAAKEARTLEGIEAKLGPSLAARQALEAAFYARRGKLLDEFADKERKTIQENQEKFEKGWLGSLELGKGLYDTLGAISPVLSQQLGFKEKALELEIKSNQYAFEKKLLELEKAHIVDEAQANELRGLQALQNQYRRYNLNLENSPGLKGWAGVRNKETAQRNPIKDLMGNAENFITNAFSAGIQGVLTGEKDTLKNIGKTMFRGFIGEIHKGGITRSFDALAKLVAPHKQKDDEGLTGAGQLLNSAGAQLITSAGGLMLSGIGIMTNSQVLVIAGTVLQMAGMAIAVYQALTSIKLGTAGGILAAAGAQLTVAANMLAAVAIKQSIPIVGHTGLALPRFHLGSDEIPAILQRGEWVLNRNAVGSLKSLYGPNAFAMFNAGQAPALPVPVPVRGGMGGEIGKSSTNVRITLNAPITINPRQEMTQRDYDRHIKMIFRSLDKETGRYGIKLRPGR